MNKLEIAKKATTLIVGLGASKIAQTIIKNNVAPETVIDKVTVTSASVVLGMMVSESSKKFTEAKIDEIVASVGEMKAKIQEAKIKQDA